jgi:Mn-containing catalase
MKIISELSEMITDELDGAEEYIEAALHYKEEYPALAKVLYEISTEEMRHMEMLHIEVVNLIEKYRKERGEPPAAMLAVYEYLHKKNIEQATKIRMYQSQFKS